MQIVNKEQWIKTSFVNKVYDASFLRTQYRSAPNYNLSYCHLPHPRNQKDYATLEDVWMMAHSSHRPTGSCHPWEKKT